MNARDGRRRATDVTKPSYRRKHENRLARRAIGALALASPASAQGVINVYCSVQVEWCTSDRQRVPEGDRHQGVDDPEGLGRDHRAAQGRGAEPQAATSGSAAPAIRICRRPRKSLTEPYKSPKLSELHPWAVKQNTDPGGKTVGIYAGALGFGFNTELLAKKNAEAPACWADLLKPEFKGEIQMANPNSSGTAYVGDRHAGAADGRGQGVRAT